MRILVVDTYYPEFLTDLYSHNSRLAELDYARQRDALFATGFGVSDAYPYYLRAAGCEAEGIICNADPLQNRWVAEHGLTDLSSNIHERRRQIVAAQVADFRPDVLYVFEWSPLGDRFLTEMQQQVSLVVGQMASPLAANRSYSGYQMMVSSWPPIVDYFRRQGAMGAHLELGFDPRVAEKLTASRPTRISLQVEPTEQTRDRLFQSRDREGAVSSRPNHGLCPPTKPPEYDVTFVGGFAPSHPDRIEWLESLLEHVDLTVFGYGREHIPPQSKLHRVHCGPVWGWAMYDVLRKSKITLNRHAVIDVRGAITTNLATNMRLYEATGVGTCLLTEAKDNLVDLFSPAHEVAVYHQNSDCIDTIKHLLANKEHRENIAKAGQKKTLALHGYDRRMQQLADILNMALVDRRRETRDSPVEPGPR